MKWNLPYTGRINKYRTGTKRAELIMMLKDGATFDECRDAFGWHRDLAWKHIRLLHTYVGFGLRQEDDGRIYLVWD